MSLRGSLHKHLNKLYFPSSCPEENVQDLLLGNGNVIGELYFQEYEKIVFLDLDGVMDTAY